MEPLWKFLLVALIAPIIGLMLSALAARVRFSAPRGLRLALDILFLLPLAIPGGSVGFFPLYDRFAFATPVIVIATDMLWALPVFYLCAIMGFRKVTHETIDAARLQGLGFCGIFCRLFLTPARLWLLLGIIIGFCRGALLAWVIKPNL